MGDTTQAPPPAELELAQLQLDDFADLLALSVIRGNIGWLGMTVLGPDVLKEAGNEIGEIGAFARKMVQSLQAAGKIPQAIALLRQESHRNTRLMLGLTHILNGDRLNDAEALQAFVNEYEPFLSSAGMEERLPRLLRTICAVALGDRVDGITGSGFLIAPQLVMTNFHVIEPYLEVNQASGEIKANGLGSQMYFFFDYLSAPPPKVPPSKGASHTSIMVTAAEDWLVYARNLLRGDGQVGCPAPANKEFDYAVIRLAEPIGESPVRRSGGALRGWLPLRDTIDVDSKRRIMVFQHPGKAPQQFDIGDYVQLDPSATRVRYSVSTAKGSSGGAAVDSDGLLFALHNAEVEQVAGVAAGNRLNQGVRIDLITRDLLEKVPELSKVPAAPGEDNLLIWSLNDDLLAPLPIIGRTEFRKKATRMNRPNEPRVMVVTGPAGSGLRFSIKLLRRNLGAQTPVVVFPATDLQKLTPTQFLRVLVQELGVSGLAGKPIPEAPSTENLSLWLREDLPKWLLARLMEQEARDRARFPAWVVMDTVLLDAQGKGQRLLWAENLRDFVAAAVSVHDAGQIPVEIPQLRWLFLASEPGSLPLSGIPQLEEDLNNYTTYEQDFVDCIQSAMRSFRGGDQLPWAPFQIMAGYIAANRTPTLPLRKALADFVRESVAKAVAERQAKGDEI